jgi:hypothetical protein
MVVGSYATISDISSQKQHPTEKVVRIEKQARLLPARPSLNLRQRLPDTKDTLTAQWVWFVS